MKNGTSLTYDGSFEGFLCCIFQAFEEKLIVTSIYRTEEDQKDLFAASQLVLTEMPKAERVMKAIKKMEKGQVYQKVFFAFLSETQGSEFLLFRYLKMAFTEKNFSSKDFGHPDILKVTQLAKMVSREKHRMEAFIRFKLTKDDVFFAVMEPDFHVLPVILPHFESRYADQKWIIYDLKRKIGLYYNLEKTEFISLDLNTGIDINGCDPSIYDTSEIEFQKLWKQYFDSTNIKSRINLRLHTQHVPKRYWKYLSEKSSLSN